VPIATPPQPQLIVIAGPNGSGKSSFFAQHLAFSSLPFINADLIAIELDEPDDLARARQAANLAAQARETLISQRLSFITETVLSDPVGDKVAKFAAARSLGYFLDVHFISLASPELSQARVIDRVSRGGHDVPDDRIFGRYPRTMQNLIRLLDVADRLSIYDNSELDHPHRLIALLEGGVLVSLADPQPAWLEAIDLTKRRTSFTRPL
jgi:predicted ABC-type ATPase